MGERARLGRTCCSFYVPLWFLGVFLTLAVLSMHAALHLGFLAHCSAPGMEEGHEGPPQLQREAHYIDSAEEDQIHKKRAIPVEHLSRELFEAVQRDPTLLAKELVAQAFLATPWLVPPKTTQGSLLPSYRGLENDLDALLAARSQKIGIYMRAISTVYFSHHHTLLLQNWVYTAVKWASITNYIVVTWDDQSLSTCLDMNLPCFNATVYLPVPLNGTAESTFYRNNFVAITWIKPLLARDLVQRGYLVHVSDVDIAFPPKAFWPSMLKFLEPAGADVAMERDYFGPINCGSMVILPSTRNLAWLDTWVQNATADTMNRMSSQKVLGQLAKAKVYQMCNGPWDCRLMREKRRKQDGKQKQELVLVRRYLSGWEGVFQDHCAGRWLEWVTPIDPCMPTSINYHVICISGAANKTKALKAAGLWFMDDETTSGCTESPFTSQAEGDALGGSRRSGGQDAWWEALGLSPGSEPGGKRAARVLLAARQLQGGRERQIGKSAATMAALQSAQQSWARRRALSGGVPGQQRRGLFEVGPGSEGPAVVPRCMPLWWRLPRQENAFLRCDREQLAFVFYPQTD